MRRFVVLIVISLIVGIAVGYAQGKTIHVKVGGTGDGSSWSSAYGNLQTALDDAEPNDSIWVAEGTYVPTKLIDPCDVRTATFQMKNGVGIYGGFSSVGDPNLESRDWEKYETVLSGDIGVLDEPNDNCYQVFYHPNDTNLDLNAVLEGFSITGAYLGGMYNVGSSPVIINCTFRGNYCGGMWNEESSPTVTNCTFRLNGGLGGMLNEVNSNPTVTNCTFTDNRSSIFGGGGMTNAVNSNPTITNCIFSGNFTQGDGGGMHNEVNSSPTVTNCTFSGNEARYTGGGIFNYESSPTITNCTFIGNKSEYDGGGMYSRNYSHPTVTNCTFTANSAYRNGGGGMCNWGSCNPTVTNCVLWENAAPSDPQISGSGSATVSYSDVQGGYSGIGNINADPCFVDPDNDDYHLKSQAGRFDPTTQSWVYDDVTSPCIDAGDPLSPIGAEPFPNGGIINMGAYGATEEASKSYFGKPPCEIIVAGDVNGDCLVNFLDFRLMALHWCEDNSP